MSQRMSLNVEPTDQPMKQTSEKQNLENMGDDTLVRCSRSLNLTNQQLNGRNCKGK